jgi:predicted TIM-barrel fold metal-dependent hydrolase
VVKTLVQELGADKLLWGSDMPSCELVVTYRQSLLLFQTQCDFLTSNQRAAVLGENLSRLYPG